MAAQEKKMAILDYFLQIALFCKASCRRRQNNDKKIGWHITSFALSLHSVEQWARVHHTGFHQAHCITLMKLKINNECVCSVDVTAVCACDSHCHQPQAPPCPFSTFTITLVICQIAACRCAVQFATGCCASQSTLYDSLSLRPLESD